LSVPFAARWLDFPLQLTVLSVSSALRGSISKDEC